MINGNQQSSLPIDFGVMETAVSRDGMPLFLRLSSNHLDAYTQQGGPKGRPVLKLFENESFNQLGQEMNYSVMF